MRSEFAQCMNRTVNWLAEVADRKGDPEVAAELSRDVSALHIVNPLSPSQELKEVEVVKVFKSHSRPMLLRTDRGELLIVKPDPVVKDCLTMCAFSVFNAIWKEENKPFRAVYYQILPVGQFGVLECLADVESVEVWDAEGKWEKIAQLDKESRENFLATAVGGFVAASILGVRDRHKDNMLVVSGREFAMIDFEYLFNLGLMIDAPSFAMSSQMAQCIKSMGDKYWRKFETDCRLAFLALRRKQELVVNLVYQLFVDTNLYVDKEVVKSWLLHVFRVSGSEEDALEVVRNGLYPGLSPLWALKNSLHTVHAMARK